MARIRSIKPEAFTSESLSRLDYFTRWTFAGLWTYLDDEGYGRGDSRLIRAALFPLDDDVTNKKVEKAIDALVAEGCTCRYEVDGRRFIHAPKWSDHQKVNRPTKTKFPRCPGHDSGKSGAVLALVGALTEDSLRAHGAVTEDSRGEQGTGNREQGTSSAFAEGVTTDPFAEFWKEYPRKVAKADAQKAYSKAVRKAEPEVILAGVRAHLPAWSKTELTFVPHPATWLNGERWTDTPQATPALNTNMPEGW